jgi:hypothetical protein
LFYSLKIIPKGLDVYPVKYDLSLFLKCILP